MGQSYLVSYAYDKGFGRRLFTIFGPMDEAKILYLEESKLQEGAVIIAISKIDGTVSRK
jgi:hypothetical protein